MMVETILESSQDFGMSNGSLPQWKRELLQRRAARTRTSAQTTAPTPPPLPPPPPPLPALGDADDEELPYGPGIVMKLKSRYLSLALRDAPRRRPSVLRRATSLEHLLDERTPQPPAPAPRSAANPRSRPPRPASVAAPPVALATRALVSRRDSVKRARSVDALSRLAREEPPPPSPSPPPPLHPPVLPRPVQPRTARVPRRPTPLLRETERPPPDLVRSALRKFEGTPVRKPQPAARVSAVLRGLEPSPWTSTPEPVRDRSPPRSPSPLPIEPIAVEEPTPKGISPSTKHVSRAALEEIARAGSTTRYSFEAPRVSSHLPPLAATNPVLAGRARRVGVIRPMPAPPLRTDRDSPVPVPRPNQGDSTHKLEETVNRVTSPSIESEPTVIRGERKEPTPSAAIEPIPRPLNEIPRTESPRPVTPPVNGLAKPEPKQNASCKIGSAGIERAWSGSQTTVTNEAVSPWGAQRKARAPPPAATIMVFNFSDRKEVPDYIENDGVVLRGSRKNTFKAGEAGVVVLRPEALLRDSDSEVEDEIDCGPPSPCSVRFLNANVLINGKSSMAANPNRERIAKLKLQFDDSLTRTFEYPSESSMCEDTSPADERPPAETPPQVGPETTVLAPLAANTHIASAALSRYTPSKTVTAPFQLGLTRCDPPTVPVTNGDNVSVEGESGVENALDGGEVRACGADAARSWSESRTHATDLLF